MRNVKLWIAAIGISALAVPAIAQPKACLQLNRIYSTNVVNDDTLVATDYSHRTYTIHMIGRCVGLNPAAQNLSFRRAGEIGDEYLCLDHGDTLGYSFPGDPSMGLNSITVHGAQGQMQCTVDFVTAGPPAPPPPPHG